MTWFAGGVALLSKPARSISDSHTSIGLFDKQRRLQLAWTQDDYKNAGPIPEQVCISSSGSRIDREIPNTIVQLLQYLIPVRSVWNQVLKRVWLWKRERMAIALAVQPKS